MNETAQREMARRLARLGVDMQTALTISCRVRRPEHEEEMLKWLRENPDADPMAAVLAAREIAPAR